MSAAEANKTPERGMELVSDVNQLPLSCEPRLFVELDAEIDMGAVASIRKWLEQHGVEP